ncbi:Bor family protein [Wenyingzhuangia sp. IMCC45533]
MKKIAMVAALCMSLTSCYVHEYTIGNGAKSSISKTKKNHFVIRGLAPIKTAQPEAMAQGAKDYTVKTRFSFIDTLLNAITYGIYSPTTTTVTK